MTNPTPTPPQTTQKDFDIRIGEAEQELETHTNRLFWALTALEILAVCYTLPHNLTAFGVDFDQLGAAVFFGILGVATLEGSFLFSAYHFTHGLLTTPRQTAYAKWGLGIMTAVLFGNSIVAQLIHLNPQGPLLQIVLGYQGFFLPITPVIALLAAVLLIFQHPSVQQAISEYNHIVTIQKAQQKAEIAEQKALQAVGLARIEAKELHAKAEAKQISIKSADEIAQLELTTELEQQARELEGLKRKIDLANAKEALLTAQKEAEEKRKFSAAVNTQTAKAMREKVTEILGSDELKEIITSKAGTDIAKALDIAPNSKLGKKLSGN